MAYGAYLELDQDTWFRNDFSDTNKLTGTIYEDIQMTNPLDLTGYTLTLKFFRPATIVERFSETASIETATSGTWSYAVGQAEMPPPGIYHVKMELTQTGRQESTLNTVEIYVLEGPAA